MTPKNKKPLAFIIFAIALIGDIFVWQEVFVSGAIGGLVTASAPVTHEYFLDVGQGDSELMIFPGNIKVITDAGPDDALLTQLARVLSPSDNYIDLAIISQPQLDDYGGYNFLLDHYRVGAFIYNGRDDEPDAKEWFELKARIRAKGIPLITLGAGDRIHIGNGSVASGSTTNGSSTDEIDILSPNPIFDQSVALSDTGLVELVKTPEFRTLLTADVGTNVEDWLVKTNAAIRADVLKVPNHAASDSVTSAFLRVVSPSVAIIEASDKKVSDHPASSTLAQLTSKTDALILRTDYDGTIEIYPDGSGKLKIVKELK